MDVIFYVVRDSASILDDTVSSKHKCDMQTWLAVRQ